MKTLWFCFKKVVYYLMYLVFAFLTYGFLLLVAATLAEDGHFMFKAVVILLFALFLLLASLFYKLVVKPKKRDK